MEKTSAKTAQHFNWGDSCEGWWLKDSGNFVVVEEKMPPGTSEVMHYHEKTEQFFYVLEGRLKMECNQEIYDLKPYEGITVKARSVHRVFNSSTQEVRFLVISSQNSRDDRVDVEELSFSHQIYT